MHAPPAPTALVFSGGGARGAYEAGAVAELLPALPAPPAVLTGASIGAANAAAVAGLLHRDPEEAAAELRRRWLELTLPRVLRPLLRDSLPRLALRAARALATGRGVRPAGLFDASPLAETLRTWVDWPALHANVAAGRVAVLAVVATRARDGRPVAFHEGGRPAGGPERLAFVPARLGVEHLRASSAIPLVLAPEPVAGHGFHLDGSVALHRPLAPAWALGARRAIVLCDSVPGPSRGPAPPGDAPPTPAAAGMALMTALVADPLLADVERAGDAVSLIAPESRTEITDLAAAVLAERRHRADLRVLRRLLGREDPRASDLLSYVLFERDFIAELLRLGARDARRCLDRSACAPAAPRAETRAP